MVAAIPANTSSPYSRKKKGVAQKDPLTCLYALLRKKYFPKASNSLTLRVLGSYVGFMLSPRLALVLEAWHYHDKPRMTSKHSQGLAEEVTFLECFSVLLVRKRDEWLSGGQPTGTTASKPASLQLSRIVLSTQ